MKIHQNKLHKSTPTSSSPEFQQIIRRRRLSVYMIISAFLTLLLLFNLGNFLFLHQMSNQLELGLGARLLSVAKLAATIVENEYLNSLIPDAKNQLTLLVIQDRLHEIKNEHQLEGLYIINRSYQTILDSNRGGETNMPRTYLQTDATWIDQAWHGTAVASSLHIFGGQKFKSAYAPIHNLSDQVIGVLATEANAYFFVTLDRYRNAFLIAAMISAGVFLLFTGFLLYALRLFIRTQESLYQSERLAMMGQMAAMLAHEIRNPLGIIRGTADILRSRYSPKDQPEPLFQYIPDEVNRLNKLVNNFLTFSRETPLALAKHDLNQLITDTVEKIRLDEKRVNARIEFMPAALDPFYFDPNGIEQVLVNLIQNSLQAIDSAGMVTLRTRIVEKKKKTWIQIEVHDDGQGIDGDPQVVFEPFYTTKSSGSGLGMAVAKKIIEKHNGFIDIISHLGESTTVTILLPCRSKEEN